MPPILGAIVNYAFQMLSGYDVFDGKEMKWKCIKSFWWLRNET